MNKFIRGVTFGAALACASISGSASAEKVTVPFASGDEAAALNDRLTAAITTHLTTLGATRAQVTSFLALADQTQAAGAALRAATPNTPAFATAAAAFKAALRAQQSNLLGIFGATSAQIGNLFSAWDAQFAAMQALREAKGTPGQATAVQAVRTARLATRTALAALPVRAIMAMFHREWDFG